MAVTFVILYRPGEAWTADKPVWEQNLRAHGNYMKHLYDSGKLAQGGPFSDNFGGLVLLRVADADEAERILQDDPALASGVMVGEVHPWYPVDWDRFGT